VFAVTPGEPAGIGPDCVAMLAAEARRIPWIAIGDGDMLCERAQRLGFDLSVDDHVDRPSVGAGMLSVDHVPVSVPVEPGLLNPANAEYVLATLDRAIDGCLDGRYRAMVTGPVQKSILNSDVRPFTGHTEYLRDRAGARAVTMLLVTGNLRVALATTHLPLRDVPDALTMEGLETQITILLHGLEHQFGIDNPRVLIAGLNPHAGESGHLGTEEIDVIAPVCEQFRARGLDVRGPLPADTVFTRNHLDKADAVLAMYHDQGLPVLKFAGFGNAVNVTLGLPFTRTSVDHGTALDIAGCGDADPGSLRTAIELADQLAGSEKKV
jgi:4-hydroxythreonine-4-phosphate dehydrogenase